MEKCGHTQKGVVFFMDQNLEYRQQLLEAYKQQTAPFWCYLPWLEKHAGQTGSTYYHDPEATEHSFQFPVYDSTLMRFVKEMSGSALMDKNYQYIYTRNRIKNHEEERKVIQGADLREWDMLRGILSKYVLGGRTKGYLWSQGLQEDIYYLVLKQMQKIIEYWDRPLGMEDELQG